MGKIVNLRMTNLPLPKNKPADAKAVKSAMSLRRTKDAVLSESNRIAHEHGHFRATAAGKPTLAYGQGHDMRKHGEGKPYKAHPEHAAKKNALDQGFLDAYRKAGGKVRQLSSAEANKIGIKIVSKPGDVMGRIVKDEDDKPTA